MPRKSNYYQFQRGMCATDLSEYASLEGYSNCYVFITTLFLTVLIHSFQLPGFHQRIFPSTHIL